MFISKTTNTMSNPKFEDYVIDCRWDSFTMITVTKREVNSPQKGVQFSLVLWSLWYLFPSGNMSCQQVASWPVGLVASMWWDDQAVGGRKRCSSKRSTSFPQRPQENAVCRPTRRIWKYVIKDVVFKIIRPYISTFWIIINTKGLFTPSVRVNSVSTLGWCLRHSSHWPQWSRSKMGWTPFSSDSIVANENCVTSIIAALIQTDSDAWCKRALKSQVSTWVVHYV